MEDEEIQKHIDRAEGYYIGLWNILITEGAPESVIINQAINNMATVLDRYLDSDHKIEILEKVLATLKEEAAQEKDIIQ